MTRRREPRPRTDRAVAGPRPVADIPGSAPRRQADPLALEIPTPASGEPIAWTAGLRVDLPDYVGEQIREACHRMRCTQVALVLRLLAQFRDNRGRPMFSIREEDLVADRRKRRT